VGLEQLLDFGAPHFGAATLYARAGDDGALTKPLQPDGTLPGPQSTGIDEANRWVQQ
jgi:hypothetical protein